MDKRQPNLFLIGAPKCGTTTLANWLGKHPKIYRSSIKEPHHYNIDERQLYYPKKSDYLSLYNDANENHVYMLDASVWYLHSKVAVSNILSDCPNARFIVCLRNPVDMAFSLHGQFLNKSAREHIGSFIHAWHLSEERMKGRKISYRVTEPKYLAYKYSCRIGSQSLRLLQQVSRDMVHFVVLDDLIYNEHDTLKKVLEFLNLSKDVKLKVNNDNVRKEVRSLLLKKCLIYIADIKRNSKLYNISTGIKKYIKNINTSKINTDMDNNTREELLKYFDNEINIIWKIVNKEYPRWKNK